MMTILMTMMIIMFMEKMMFQMKPFFSVSFCPSNLISDFFF